MNAHSLAKVKWAIRHVNFHKIEQILAKVLTFTNLGKVQNYRYEQLLEQV